MRVLWFEVTVPKSYGQHGSHVAGWQDSLEDIVKKSNNIELGIAFETQNHFHQNREIDNVHYFPLKATYSTVEKLQNRYTCDISRNKLLILASDVIKNFRPDIIHVFGSEWCYGQVVEFTDIPVVIHMQGSIPPYNNALYPPGYNECDEILFYMRHFRWKKLFNLPLVWNKRNTWKLQEEKTLSLVRNYMGRTKWDRCIVNLYNPNASYFYCSEALRSSFIEKAKDWRPTGNKRIRLITTGCSSFWKGLDTIVRTAKMLTDRNVDFEWCIAGKIANKELIEWKEKVKMASININLLGMIDADSLIQQLLKSDIYVHTAYIDNSPNSICEAQYLGVPIIATYVGGIPSLIENSKDGLLIPANDPYTLYKEILSLSADIDKQLVYSENSRKRARMRHDPNNIYNDLMLIYHNIVGCE